ncbi:MAG: radical SAM protein [Negativicutes bacterium]|jgi:histone acetyltransferase (RNA polymerase elongator complex component)
MKKTILPIFLANAGCSDRCVFCNQSAVESNCCSALLAEVTTEINRQLEYLRNTDIQLAYYGGTFTSIPFEQRLALLKFGKILVDRGTVSSIRVSTRPDALDIETVQQLKNHGVTEVEIGAQSLCDSVLTANNRRHTYEAVVNSVQRVKNAGLIAGIHLMTGLMGETQETYLLTLQRLMQLAPDMLRIHPTLVLRGTKLEQLFFEGRYNPQTMKQALVTASWLKLVARSQGIRVIRTGIQPSDELRNGQVVAGPFHPAFGEMVDSVGFYCLLYLLIKNYGVDSFVCSKSELSKVVGQRKDNIRRLEAKFATTLKISVSDLLMPGEIVIVNGLSKNVLSLVDMLSYYDYLKIMED